MDERDDVIDLVARSLAANNEWAEEGTEYHDPGEWRVEAAHVVDDLIQHRWIVLDPDSERATIRALVRASSADLVEELYARISTCPPTTGTING